jgi:natural product precursor
MNKNAASNGKKLSLRVETLRNLSAQEMNQIKGGFNCAGCWTVVVPSSGITLTYPIETTYCN